MFHIPLSFSPNVVPSHSCVFTHVRIFICFLAQAELLVTSVIDWFFFLVLDIGNAVVEDIPLGTRFVVGLFQAIAVRSAGFSAVSLAAVAAGVKFALLSNARVHRLNPVLQSPLRRYDVYQCL